MESASPPVHAPPPPPPVRWQGNVQVNVNVPATVYLNDERAGETQPNEPLNKRGVPIGRAKVRVEATGYKPATQWARVQRDEWVQLIFDMEPIQAQTAVEPPDKKQLRGVYTIQQKSNGRFMDAYDYASGADYRLVTRTAQDDDSQRWLIKEF